MWLVYDPPPPDFLKRAFLIYTLPDSQLCHSLRTSDCSSPDCPWIDATPTAKLLFRKYVPKKLPTTAVHQSGMSSHLCTHYSQCFSTSAKKNRPKKIHHDFYLHFLDWNYHILLAIFFSSFVNCVLMSLAIRSPLLISVQAKSLQLCVTLCNPLDFCPPGSSVDWILQARILEWVAMPSSKGSSWPQG